MAFTATYLPYHHELMLLSHSMPLHVFMASLQHLVSKTLKPLCTQKTYKEAMLFHDWESVVGAEFARGFMPVEIYNQPSGNVLKLMTSSSGMATARYMEPALLQRVNQFFGSPYISSVKTTQGQVKTKIKKPLQQDAPSINTLDEALQALGKHFNVT